MESKKIETRQELENNWKHCFIVGCGKHQTKKDLIEGFELGLKVLKEVSN